MYSGASYFGYHTLDHESTYAAPAYVPTHLCHSRHDHRICVENNSFSLARLALGLLIQTYV